jgi:hypothetical protein
MPSSIIFNKAVFGTERGTKHMSVDQWCHLHTSVAELCGSQPSNTSGRVLFYQKSVLDFRMLHVEWARFNTGEHNL